MIRRVDHPPTRLHHRCAFETRQFYLYVYAGHKGSRSRIVCDLRDFRRTLRIEKVLQVLKEGKGLAWDEMPVSDRVADIADGMGEPRARG